MSSTSSVLRSTRCGVIRNESASSRAEKAPCGADHQPLLVAPADELAELPAQLLLPAGGRPRLGRRAGPARRAGPGGVARRSGSGPSPRRLALMTRLGGELQGLEPLERLLEVGPAGHDAVVLQDDAVEPRRRTSRRCSGPAPRCRAGRRGRTRPRRRPAGPGGRSRVSGTRRQMLKATRATGWAWTIARRSGRAA